VEAHSGTLHRALSASGADAGILFPLLSGTIRAIRSSSAVAELIRPCCNMFDRAAFRFGHTRAAARTGETQQPSRQCLRITLAGIRQSKREEVLHLGQPKVSHINHKRVADYLILHERVDQKTHAQGHPLPIANSVADSMAALDVLVESDFALILHAWMRSR